MLLTAEHNFYDEHGKSLKLATAQDCKKYTGKVDESDSMKNCSPLSDSL
jgi:hypothetical protein